MPTTWIAKERRHQQYYCLYLLLFRNLNFCWFSYEYEGIEMRSVTKWFLNPFCFADFIFVFQRICLRWGKFIQVIMVVFFSGIYFKGGEYCKTWEKNFVISILLCKHRIYCFPYVCGLINILKLYFNSFFFFWNKYFVFE